MIYFDSAATSLLKPAVVGQAVLQAMDTFGGAGRGSHPAAMAAARCVYQARYAVAELLGSAPERTVFTANATDSLNIAIQGLLTPSDHVITTALEHNSVLRPLYRLRTQGMGLSIVSADARGNLDYSLFRQYLRRDTRAVVCTHSANLTGALTDIPFLASFCRENGLLLIVDAAQSAGIFPIHGDNEGIDVLCFTGHKGLMGPQGTGGLCIRKGLKINPLKIGGSGLHSFSEEHPKALPEALEAGTLNAHGIAGLLAGVRYIRQKGLDTILERELSLTHRFWEGIRRLPGVHIYGDMTQAHGPIVTLNIDPLDSGALEDLLASRYDICVRSGAHCAPLAHRALCTERRGAVRFSFSFFNTEEEVDAGIRAVEEIAYSFM